jgi:8-oxo-dGTP pyrophosphatase MutT (NUDIX family)
MATVPAHSATCSIDHHGQRCSCGGPCVPQVVSAPQRLAALRAAVAAEAEPLVTLTQLVRVCRDEHALLWERSADRDCRLRVSTVLRSLPEQAGGDVLQPRVRRLMAAALEPIDGVPTVVVAHALAGFVDARYGDTFAASFRRRSPYQPAVGDPMPLDSPDLRTVMAMRPTSPPWRLANRLDETRRVRLAGEWAVQFRVVFDYSLFDALAGVVTADTLIATCHPNRGLVDFDLSRTGDGRTFPVRPADPQRQRAEINRLIAAAVAAGASIVVLPELSITESLGEELRDWVRRPGKLRLLVAGSYHHQDRNDTNGGAARRRNTAICWVRGHDGPLVHDKHSPAEAPIAEDIQPLGWPELRIYVTADGWHLAVAICRDLLNPQAVNALAEAGANVVLVPAMSETLVPFGGPVAHLVGARQAIVAVANNPADWSKPGIAAAGRAARGLFGHPGFGQQTRLVHAPDTAPGLAVLAVHSARLAWLPAGPGPATPSLGEPPRPPRPDWLQALRAAVQDPPDAGAVPADPAVLRPAAVLVLLTDGADGPQVLLTERAPDLADYPGLLTFPGGRTEPPDHGPVDTALREAAEEVGLDPRTIDVLGVLPSFALPDSGFLVTPVLAWSSQPVTTGPTNLAEVTAIRQAPLRSRPDRNQEPSPDARAEPHLWIDDTWIRRHDHATVGIMTAAVINMLVGVLTRSEQPREERSTAQPTD